MTPRFWSLVLKELRQIRRDKRLVLSLIIPRWSSSWCSASRWTRK